MGDRVRAVVLSQEDYSRFSLSTAELEEQPGDMLRDKVRLAIRLQTNMSFSAPCVLLHWHHAAWQGRSSSDPSATFPLLLCTMVASL